MPVNTVISKQNAPHYTWGNSCDGWHLLQTGELSIIEEKMPPGTAEQLHYHEKAQQCFYITAGIATFEIDGAAYVVRQGESMHILPKQQHRIMNNNEGDLSFILVSQPKAHGDRINL